MFEGMMCRQIISQKSHSRKPRAQQGTNTENRNASASSLAVQAPDPVAKCTRLRADESLSQGGYASINRLDWNECGIAAATKHLQLYRAASLLYIKAT